MRLYLILISFCLYTGLASAQPDSLSSILSKVRSLKAQKKLDEALAETELQLKKPEVNGDRSYLLIERGELAYELGNFDKAEESFQGALTGNSNLKEYAHYYLAQIYSKKINDKKFEEKTRSELKAVLVLSPNIKMQNEVNFQLAKIYLHNRKFRDARIILIKQERRNRREEIYPSLIYELARAERGLRNTIRFCKWTRKIYAHFPEYEVVQSWGLDLSKDLIDNTQTHCWATPDDKKTRIKNLLWAGLATKAIEEIQLLGEGSPADKKEAESLQITYLLYQGEVGKAMAILKSHYDANKRDPNFLMTVGNASARMGDSQAAVGSLYAAYKRRPHGKFGKQALYQAAFMSYQFQDYDGAARKFQEFMKVFPRSGLTRDAKWHLAWIRYLRGDYESAYKSLSDLKHQVRRSRHRVIKVYSDQKVAYWSAMCLLRMGRYSESRTLFEALAADKLLGFYTIAAQSRLKKIEAIVPKIPKRVILDQNMKTPRFAQMEALMPADDPAWFRNLAAQNADKKSESEDVEISIASSVNTATDDNETEQEVLAPEDGKDQNADVPEASDDEDQVTSFKSPILMKRFERAQDLIALGMQNWARWDLYDIERKTRNREYLKTLMQEYELVENFNRSAYIGQVTFGSQRASYGIDGDRSLWEHAFPRAYSIFVHKYSHEFSVPSELVWGIMRAESQYKKDIVSPVGALGLMQVMPFTAQKVANLLGEKSFDSKKLLQPENAIKIGSRYLQKLMKKFEGNIALVAAAYNAGPHRVQSWMSSFGQLDLDEFIEHIPYFETREYVKKVISNYNTYSRLYGGKKDSISVLSEALHIQIENGVVAKESWEDI